MLKREIKRSNKNNINKKQKREQNLINIKTPDFSYLDPIELNNNKTIKSNAEIFLKPLLTENTDVDYNIYTNNKTEYNISEMFRFSLDMYQNYINKNNLNISCDVFKFYLSEKIVDNYNYNIKIKNCILIASFLSPLYEFDNKINMNNFILGSIDDKKMIIDMIKLIFNNNTHIDEYMLIPKYITIIDKIGRSGVLSYINYLKNIKCNNIYNEMVKYCHIVLDYQFNVNQINKLYNLRIYEVKNLYDFLTKNVNATIDDILFFLD
jgi:hypothetical protein